MYFAMFIILSYYHLRCRFLVTSFVIAQHVKDHYLFPDYKEHRHSPFGYMLATVQAPRLLFDLPTDAHGVMEQIRSNKARFSCPEFSDCILSKQLLLVQLAGHCW